jgi:hypothetical protein
MHDKGI